MIPDVNARKGTNGVQVETLEGKGRRRADARRRPFNL
jgi:hypothetical protein